MDTNTAQFPEDGYDLVVNFAAGHHIARLDRVFRRLAEMLPEDGIFVSWEYIGPHRNQYSTTQWEAAWQINKQLPAELRQELNYPHLPTMLATDPTEAIHSELIVETLNRYFESIHDRALGGAVGYPLLTFNSGIHSRDPERVFDAVATILEADAAFTDLDPRENTLFAYIIARPNKVALQDGAQLAQWSREENEREAAAARSGGAYYPPTMLAELFEKIYAARDAARGQPPNHAQPGSDVADADRHGIGPIPAIDPARRLALPAKPSLRARIANIPGARPAYSWLRSHNRRARS